MRIRILLLSGLHCERPRLYFEPLKLLNFDFNSDPADPDPASKNNVDPDPQSCCKDRKLFYRTVETFLVSKTLSLYGT